MKTLDTHNYESKASRERPLAPMACRKCGATIHDVEDGLKPKTCPADQVANDK